MFDFSFLRSGSTPSFASSPYSPSTLIAAYCTEVSGSFNIAMNFGMAPANGAFCELNDEAAAHCEEFNALNEEYFENVWYWTTPIEQCLDGRTEVRCTSFQEWTDAWVSVKG